MKKFYLWLVVTTVTHLFVLCAAVFFQIWNADNNVKPKIVSVTLVSLPAPVGGIQELSDGEGGAEEIPVQVLTRPTPSPAVERIVHQPVAKEPQPRPALLPKVVAEKSPALQPADNHLQKALDRIKVLVDQKNPPPQPLPVNTLNSALVKLQQKVKSSGSGNGGASGGRGAGGGEGKGYGTVGTSKSYKAAVALIIQQNWAFSGTLLKNSKNSNGMAVYVRINILPDGTINQIIFDKRSVSEYLNNSVKKAIEKSSPLPVLPKEEGSRDIWIGFVFSPEGIE
ncbi:MAG: energy transducer TonB [Chlorobiaceae bacterium]